MLCYSEYLSPIGRLLLADEDGCLAGLWLDGQKYFPQIPCDAVFRQTDVLADASNWLDRYFSGKRPDIHALPLLPKGTEFQKQVWQLLAEIPYGSTRTYAEIAHTLAERRGLDRMSAQAVGGAVGRNPISIVIPCHRVLGSDGSLTGYAGGIEKKQWLLAFEAQT